MKINLQSSLSIETLAIGLCVILTNASAQAVDVAAAEAQLKDSQSITTETALSTSLRNQAGSSKKPSELLTVNEITAAMAAKTKGHTAIAKI